MSSTEFDRSNFGNEGVRNVAISDEQITALMVPPIVEAAQEETIEDLLLPLQESESQPLPINGLLNPLDLENQQVISAFKSVVEEIVQEHEGLVPEISVVWVQSPYDGSLVPRVVARFECQRINSTQLSQLEEIAVRAYGDETRTTKNKNGRTAATHLYPKIDARGKGKGTVDTIIGWYFGNWGGTPNRIFPGMSVYRQIGRKDIASGLRSRDDGEWFTQEVLFDNSGREYDVGKYIVEIRAAGSYNVNGRKALVGPYQTDLAEQIAYVSMVLAGKDLPSEKPGLLYEIYHKMNQIGLGPSTSLPGLEEQIDEVKRVLITPLASPNLTRSLKGSAKSVGLIGQVGTGKTQAIKSLLREDHGVMIVPVPVQDFIEELNTPTDYRKLLPRIREVAGKIGKSVVLVIEDLENLADENNPASKALLNELAGLYQSGYRILWTTNHLEVFNPQLLEPERLGGSVIFTGLPNQEARRLILDQHLLETSRTLGLPLFSEKQESLEMPVVTRDNILDALAGATNGFTPRFLKDIVVEAVSNLMYRIAREKNRIHGLQESDLQGQSFSYDDWAIALRNVASRYDSIARIKEDERQLAMVRPGIHGRRENLGFSTNGSSSTSEEPVAVIQFQQELRR